MSAQPPLRPVPPPSSPGRFVRVEYLDFQDVAQHREFRLRVCGLDGSTEFRLRIEFAAFAAGGVRLQDGPEVCYQKLLRAVAAGETASPDAMTIGDIDLATYREAHTKVPKHRTWTPSSRPAPDIVPRRQPRRPSPQLPVAPLVDERRRAGTRGGPARQPRNLRSRRDGLIEPWSYRRSLRSGRGEDVPHVAAQAGRALRAPHVGSRPARSQPTLPSPRGRC